METEHNIFLRQNLETVETVSRKETVEDNQQCPPEDHQHQNILRFYGFKHLSQPASTDQPPKKKSKMNDVNGAVDYDDGSESSKLYTRRAYLSEFVKFLQTNDGGSMTKKEASAHAHQVVCVMEEMDGDSDTIHCPLDHKRVSEWKQPLDGKRRSTRVFQKYSSSLEKFYIFLGSQRLSRQLASSLDRNVPHWIKKVHELAHPRFGERMMEEATAKITVTQTSTRGDSALGLVSSNENRLVCCGIPTSTSTGQPTEKKSEKNGVKKDASAVDHDDGIKRRTAWDKEDERSLIYHFKANPGKAAIRHKLLEVEELQELVNSEGINRIYEKVKSLYKKKRVITREMQERHAWEKEDATLLLNHFKNNPGKARIQRKLSEVEELRELMNREGLGRIYEKVKSLYKKKK